MSTQIPAKGPIVRDTRTLQVVTALEERGLLPSDRHADAVEVVDRVLGDQAVAATPLRRRAKVMVAMWTAAIWAASIAST